MNLENKKNLAARTLKVGRKRILFLKSRINEIKEAITKQDMKDLKESGAIEIKEIKGRRKNKKSKSKRGVGKIRKKVNKRKQEYVKMTRKLRGYISPLKKRDKISREDYLDIRKKIRNKFFKSHSHLKEYIKNIK